MTDTVVTENTRTSAEFFGWRARERPSTSFAHTLGAAAGFFLVAATFALVIEIDRNDPQIAGVLLSLALLAIGLVAALRFPGPIRSCGVTLVVFAIPMFWLFALLADGGSPTEGNITTFYALTTICFALLYLLPGTRGRNVFLGFALGFLWTWILFEVGKSSSSAVPVFNSTSPSSGLDFGSNHDVATASLVTGFVYLLVCWLADRRRWHGLATPFVVFGTIATLLGAAGVTAGHSETSSGLVVGAAGLLIGLIAGQGHRRASTWAGVIAFVVGVILIVDDAVSGPLAVAALFAAFAVGTGAGAVVLAPRLGEHTDEAGDGDHTVAPPAAIAAELPAATPPTAPDDDTPPPPAAL